MLIGHIGGTLFPEAGIFRWTGRLAFPIFYPAHPALIAPVQNILEKEQISC